MPDLINRGYIYIAQPPLYGLKKKNSKSGKILKYLFNDEAKDQLMEELGPDADKYDMQRYKGLGEMDPEQLWETTMEPETRTLLQVSIEDAAAAELAVSELIGRPGRTRKGSIRSTPATCASWIFSFLGLPAEGRPSRKGVCLTLVLGRHRRVPSAVGPIRGTGAFSLHCGAWGSASP